MAMLSLDTHVYDRLLDCVHCGLCLSQCPTYSELGDENDSPRGRIYLMRSLADGKLEASPAIRGHLDLCLDCRACETACPSGVRYGSLIESARNTIEHDEGASRRLVSRLLDFMMFQVMPYPKKLRRWLTLARLGQAVGLDDFLRSSGLDRLLPDALVKLQAMVPETMQRATNLPAHALPSSGNVRARVGLFSGCISDVVFGQTNAATHRVLLANDCEVFVPRTQRCCGAIHHHAGRGDDARAFALANMKASLNLDLDAILVNVAGCGCMLKEYHELFHNDPEYGPTAERFIAKVKDISEFLVDLPLHAPTHPLAIKVTYHDACHLVHGQKIRNQPRELLKMIPGLDLIELKESDWCCGAAGTYNLTQPEMSERLVNRKLDNIDRTGAEVIATANAGCLLQLIQQVRVTGRRYRIVHPIDLLDEAYGTV